MATIESRIEKLEQTRPQETMDIFVHFLGTETGSDPAVMGWSFNGNDRQPVYIMREPDETGEALKVRASAAARMTRPGCSQLFFPVTNAAL